MLVLRRRTDEILRFFSCWRGARFCFWGQSISGPQLSMARQVAVASNTPGLLPYLIAAIFVPPIVVPSFLACVIVMLMAIAAATCALAADFLFLYLEAGY